MKHNLMKIKRAVRVRRQRRVRAKVFGTAARPRLAVYRSLRQITAQLIDDESGRTLAAVTDRGLSGKKTERAKAAGEKLAVLAKERGITAVVFDRGGRQYHGRIQALAEGARAGGLNF